MADPHISGDQGSKIKKRKKHQGNLEIKDVINHVKRIKHEMKQGNPARENIESLKHSGSKPYEKCRFLKFGFPDGIRDYLSSKHENSLEIQERCWPLLLSGKNLIGIAPTGSGKSLAFGIPLLLKVLRAVDSKPKGKVRPLGLVLAPTRELAIQIDEVFRGIPYFTSLRTVCLYGGVPKSSQIAELRKGASVLIATPGRLLDLESDRKEGNILSEIRYVILDEADRMLDSSFLDSVAEIFSRIKAREQVAMFSATWNSSIQKVAEKYMVDYEKVVVGEDKLSANANITQRVELIDSLKKNSRLLKLIEEFRTANEKDSRIIVFALYKNEATRVGAFLNNNGYKVLVMHSDIDQFQRQKVIRLFKEKSHYILVATDVASRGLDIPSVGYVINYTFPLTIEDYCHRIGRSGRVGKQGLSHTLFTVHDKSLSGALVNVLRRTAQNIPKEILNLGGTVKRKIDPNYGVFARDIDKSIKGKKTIFEDSSSSDEE